LLREFEGWDDRLRQLIVSATDTKRWALYDRAPLEQGARNGASSRANYVAGDGSTFDAATLADCLRRIDRSAAGSALRRYEENRRPRPNNVLLMSRGREIRNHLADGPEQRARDAELAVGDPLRQSAWLYGAIADTDPLHTA
jgi:salicylate hydroxylase